MNMKQIAKHIILAAVLLPALTLLPVSCDEEDDCTLATRAMLYCNLYRLNDAGTSYITDTLVALTVTALETDSVIINAQEDVSDLTLPLRFTADSTVLVLHYFTTDDDDDEDEDTITLSGQTDTVLVRHTNTPYFLSMDCGYQMKQYVNSVAYSRHVLDSISITDQEANIYGTENLRLYY